jgi:NAD(P)-dependent dehydrogenase (short-subunit alcohol dehydrogenase family)
VSKGGILEGKSVVVTGAGRGIGAGSAVRIAEEGARVVLAGTTRAALESVQDVIVAAGGVASVFEVDVSDGAAVHELMEFVVKTYGALDGAFNNAGVDGPLAPTAEYPEADFDRVVAVNLKGVWNCMRAQIPHMLAQGGGAIVNCASALAEVGQYNMSAYCASKAGVLGLTRSAALEYGPAGIRVNALSPGVIETPMMQTMMNNVEGMRELLLQAHPIGRLGTASEMGAAVAWLLSENASFALGANIAIDGGYLAK